MLDFMRRNANSWVMIFLFAIIIFVFAINFGPWAGGSSGTEAHYAATINGEIISMAEFRTAYASQLGRIKQFRPDYNEAQADKDGLKQIILDQLISRSLLTQLGRGKDMNIGALTLAEEVKKRVFGPDEKFNKEEYKRRVNGYFQVSLAQFEEQVEKEIVAEQMANLLGTAIFVSDDEAKELYIDENSSISLEFVKVNPKHFVVNRQVNSEEIANFKTKNVKEISEYYSENIAKYLKEKEVKASHILVKINNSGDNSNKEEQRKRAQSILDRIKNGEDFAKVALAESDDPGSKVKGGDLGFFTSAMMVDEFANAAFALKMDQISEVVESPFGFHIIKLTGEKPEEKRTESQAADEIAELLIKEKEQESRAKTLALAALQQLKAGLPLAKVNISDLVNTAATPGKEPVLFAPLADQTANFSRSASYVEKIGNPEGLITAAFALSMNENTPNDVIKVDDGFLAIRLKSKTEADLSKYTEQKETIKSRLLFPRRRAFMQQYLAQLKTAAKISYNQELVAVPKSNS